MTRLNTRTATATLVALLAVALIGCTSDAPDETAAPTQVATTPTTPELTPTDTSTEGTDGDTPAAGGGSVIDTEGLSPVATALASYDGIVSYRTIVELKHPDGSLAHRFAIGELDFDNRRGVALYSVRDTADAESGAGERVQWVIQEEALQYRKWSTADGETADDATWSRKDDISAAFIIEAVNLRDLLTTLLADATEPADVLTVTKGDRTVEVEYETGEDGIPTDLDIRWPDPEGSGKVIEVRLWLHGFDEDGQDWPDDLPA